MNFVPKKILIVDDHADGRFLLVKTIHRRLPEAVVQECCDAATALYMAKHEPPDAIIVHRAGEVDGLSMIRMLRQADTTVPIIYVSGYDRTAEALAAGATEFLNYDAWLNVGTRIAHLLNLTCSTAGPAGHADAVPLIDLQSRAPFPPTPRPGVGAAIITPD